MTCQMTSCHAPTGPPGRAGVEVQHGVAPHHLGGGEEHVAAQDAQIGVVLRQQGHDLAVEELPDIGEGAGLALTSQPLGGEGDEGDAVAAHEGHELVAAGLLAGLAVAEDELDAGVQLAAVDGVEDGLEEAAGAFATPGGEPTEGEGGGIAATACVEGHVRGRSAHQRRRRERRLRSLA